VSATATEEEQLFGAIARSGVRILLFRRRYPTPKKRLAYARRRYESWTRASSHAAKGK
jgi:hypothetical protein